MLQELAAIVELADEREMIRKQWEQDVMTMTHHQSPEAAWLQEMLEQIEKASTPDLDKRLEIMSVRNWHQTPKKHCRLNTKCTCRKNRDSVRFYHQSDL
jgi:hypothetical protein